jgi:co-chaperonin GroES (HSP10)
MITVTEDKTNLQFDGYEITDLPEDCVLLLEDDVDKTGWAQRKSGIHVPAYQNSEKDAEKFRVGTVLAVGDNCAEWIKKSKKLVYSSDQLVVFKARGYVTKSGKRVIIMGQGLFMTSVKEISEENE